MNDKEREDLQNPDNWNSENVERHTGTRDRRTIVSVGFSRADFDTVAKFAEQIGRSVSAFIRDAVLEKAQRETSRPALSFSDEGQQFPTIANQPRSVIVRWSSMSENVPYPGVATTEGTPVRSLTPR